MKILFFTQLFYPAIFGGGEYVFYHWAQELVKKGHEVFVITQNIDGEKSNQTIDGINIFRTGSSLHLNGTLPIGIFSNISYLFNSYFLGNKIIKENNIDLIHSNTYIPVISAQWCASKARIPHIATIHDVYFTSQHDFWKNWSNQKNMSKFTKFLGPLLEKKVALTNVTLFHTVSEQSKSDLESLGIVKPIKVIPNGIDLAPYNVKTIQKKFQAIYVGRLIFYKNLDVIIDAFKIVVDEIPTAQLIIVGDGPMRDYLRNKITHLNLQQNIHIKGNITDEKKYQLLNESNVLLNPSVVEGFGMVVLESFASSTPAIVSDVKPLSDLVVDSVDGFILPPKDSSLWAKHIILIFQDMSLANRMGIAGKQKVAKNYSISILIERLIELYNSVTK